MRRSKEVSNKHYCQVCKIWIENHPNNLRSHQEGGKHKYNLRKLLKSEKYRESQKKKNDDEIQKEFMKIQGVENDPGRIKKTIKQINKVNSDNTPVFRNNVFTSSYVSDNSQNHFESEDYNENHSYQKIEMGIIGQWEEVKESESAFLGHTELQSQDQTQNPFKPIEGCVQVKNHSLSQKVYSCISDFEENFQEQPFDQKASSVVQEKLNEKIKVVFKPRKVPR